MKDDTCAQFQAAFVDSLEANPPSLSDARLRAHALVCSECDARATELRDAWQSLLNLPLLEPSVALREKTQTMVLRLMADERSTARRARWLGIGQVPLAVVSALLVAAATLSLLGGVIWGSALPQGHLFFCAAILTGLLVGAFSWIYSASAVNGVHLDVAARVGVLALAITVAATTACPELQVLAWWDRSVPGQKLTALLGAGGSSLVFGFGYGLFPGFLAALFGGRLLAERPIANGFVAVGVVFLLATPVIYLQSAPFTSGVIASWLAGTAAGTLCGVFGALRVRGRVALDGASV